MSLPPGLAAAKRQNDLIRKHNLARHIPTDKQRLDFLDAQPVDVISLVTGGVIDVRNGGRGVRAAIDEHLHVPAEVPHEALVIGADLDPASLEQGDPA